MGRLVRDPERRVTANGVTVTSYSVAVERDYGSGADKVTDFLDCVAWRACGEFVAKYFRKGDMICVQGTLQTEHYTDRENKKRIAYKISTDKAYFASSKSAAQPELDDGDDDLPWVH